MESCRLLADDVLSDYQNPRQVAENINQINAYPNLDELSTPNSIRYLEDYEGLAEIGRKAILEGRILWEHPVAGEATRLGLGPKFFLTPQTLASIASVDGSEHLPITLGFRHLISPLLEIRDLAVSSGLDPAVVLSRQKMLVITSPETASELIPLTVKLLKDLVAPPNIWFMVQSSFHGLDRQGDAGWRYDADSPKRLHNHGHMAMQKTMDGQIFRFDENGDAQYFTQDQFFQELETFDDLVSYNVEDLDYLTGALDFQTLGLAVRLGHTGYGMIMEITENNPERPIKGGMCAYDPCLERDVCIESFRLFDMAPKDIKYLNKNFNHYPKPAKVFSKLHEEGLFMPVAVFEDRVYYQPVQGDLNFLTKTAFFSRRDSRPINALKTISDIPAALKAFKAQDDRKGFKDLAATIGISWSKA
jgi:hypothetical protein